MLIAGSRQDRACQRWAEPPRCIAASALPGVAILRDHLQFYSRFLFDAAHKQLAVPRFTRSARGHGAVSRDAEFIHQFAEMPEGLRGFFEKSLR